jgi:hypothetical protein
LWISVQKHRREAKKVRVAITTADRSRWASQPNHTIYISNEGNQPVTVVRVALRIEKWSWDHLEKVLYDCADVTPEKRSLLGPNEVQTIEFKDSTWILYDFIELTLNGGQVFREKLDHDGLLNRAWFDVVTGFLAECDVIRRRFPVHIQMVGNIEGQSTDFELLGPLLGMNRLIFDYLEVSAYGLGPMVRRWVKLCPEIFELDIFDDAELGPGCVDLSWTEAAFDAARDVNLLHELGSRCAERAPSIPATSYPELPEALEAIRYHEAYSETSYSHPPDE